jgi:hypothetical protein
LLGRDGSAADKLIPVRPELVEGPFFLRPIAGEEVRGFDKLSTNGEDAAFRTDPVA